MTRRYRFRVEYDGAPFSGWQRQNDRPSVQGAIETALGKLGEDAVVQGSGRTDAGVHSIGQIAHADLARPWTPFRLEEALNAHLRQADAPVAILDCGIVDDGFHARFSALARHYVYRIVPRRAPLALEAGRAWSVKVPLDVATMNEAAAQLIGEHDWTTFRSTECQAKSPVKTLDRLEIRKIDGRFGEIIEISASARSFLHNQVRSIAGALKLVGDGRWTSADLVASLEARDRKACAPVAPPHGLYLARVDYAERTS